MVRSTTASIVRYDDKRSNYQGMRKDCCDTKEACLSFLWLNGLSVADDAVYALIVALGFVKTWGNGTCVKMDSGYNSYLLPDWTAPRLSIYVMVYVCTMRCPLREKPTFKLCTALSHHSCQT